MIPYSIHFYLIHANKSISLPDLERDTKAWTLFLKIHTDSSLTFHSFSVWVSVYLACFRYIYLTTTSPYFSTSFNKSTSSSKRYWFLFVIKRLLIKFQTYNFTIACIILIFIFSLVICLPAYLYGTIKEGFFINDSFYDILNIENSKNYKYYYIDQSELNMKTEGFIFRLMFYFQAIFVKFLPCILLVIFTSLLVRSLLIKNQNKQRLINLSSQSQQIKSKNKPKAIADLSGLAASETKKNQENHGNIQLNYDQILAVPVDPVVSITYEPIEMSSTTEGGCFFKNIKMKKRIGSSNNKTTLMLIIVCILFLITELPQSVLISLSIKSDSNFYSNVYMPLGDLLDMIALINNSVSFIIYVMMSSAFKETFFKMFKKYIPNVIVKKFKRKTDAIIYV
jgi:hypothetical protein